MLQTRKIKKFLIGTILLILPCLLAAETQQQEAYYLLGNENIELRLVYPNPTNEKKIIVQDMTGKMHSVSPDPLVNSKDIQFLWLDRDKSRLYLDQKLWARMRSFSEENKGKPLALIKNNKIVDVLPLANGSDLFVEFGGTQVLELLVDTEWFKTGLVPMSAPDMNKIKNQYIVFLQAWLRDHPQDVVAVFSLANTFLDQDTEQRIAVCGKAEAVYEKAQKLNPKNYPVNEALYECYLEKQKYEQAISLLQEQLKTCINEYRWRILEKLGDVFFAKKETDQARHYYQEAITSLQKDYQGKEQLSPQRLLMFQQAGVVFPEKQSQINRLNEKITKLTNSQQ